MPRFQFIFDVVSLHCPTLEPCKVARRPSEKNLPNVQKEERGHYGLTGRPIENAKVPKQVGMVPKSEE